MHELEFVIPNDTAAVITRDSAEVIKSRCVVSDERSTKLTVFNGFWFQLWAHQCLDTFIDESGRIFNRYNGLDDGQGIYPIRPDSPLMSKGYFNLSDQGLPVMSMHGKSVEVVVDMHRGNENHILKALHLMACRIHNKRMNATGNFETAKQETLSTLNRVTCNELMKVTGLSEFDIFNDIRIDELFNSIEWPFQIARWAHSQMPDTVNGVPIFDKVDSAKVDVRGMLNESSRAMKLGVSSAMQSMTHLPSEPHQILERTFGRHVELGLACFQDLQHAIGPVGSGDDRLRVENEIPLGCPMFAGILLEAELIGDGILGPIGARAVADGVAGSLKWGYETGQGLWFPRWKGAPISTVDIVDYAYS